MARLWGLRLTAWDGDTWDSVSKNWEWSRAWDWACDWNWSANWTWIWIRLGLWNQHWDPHQDLDLDLGKLLGKIVPGYRYSATFFTTLRTNIHLSNAACVLTPMPTPPPSPLPRSLPESIPPSIPPLTTHAATTSDQKVAALRLIADSIAQQRQAASRALISHPLPVAFAVLLLGLLAHYLEWPLLLTTGAGVVMALLVAVRGATGGYLVAAEQVGWAFLQETGKSDEADDGGKGKGKGADETVVLVTVWGEEVIGTVVLKVLKKERKALVRAWTVGLRYRGKGVGKGLLEEAVRLAVTERGCKAVEFDRGHANSKRILPALFNSGFDRRDRNAQSTLADIVKAQKRA